MLGEPLGVPPGQLRVTVAFIIMEFAKIEPYAPALLLLFHVSDPLGR
jgi:hypothetical protein